MKLALLLAAVLSHASAATWYVTVTGIGGEPDYDQRFSGWAKDLDKILRAVPGSQVETLHTATREQLRASLSKLTSQAKSEDAVVLMLIGHGTHDGADYKFNLKGPDITSIEMATLLDKVPAGRQLVVNMTSASGGAIDTLKKQNRIVIAATKSGTERNATVFPRYWVEAMRDPAADVDKNETVSALEAYRYAEQKTEAFYKTQKRLATEHPMIEDTGSGEAVRAPDASKGEGRLAAAFAVLRLGGSASAYADPAKRQLLAKKENLEQEIDRLKFQKAAMPLDEYKKQLQALLLELARTQEALDK